MKAHLSSLDMDEILKEINDLPFKIDGSMALMAFAPSNGIPTILKACPNIEYAINEITFITDLKPVHVMINKLPPGVVVPEHTDTLKEYKGVRAPRLKRWHLPIKTNPECYWWDEDDEEYLPEQGYWFGPVKYWRKHSVGNRGTEERVHLVVDLA